MKKHLCMIAALALILLLPAFLLAADGKGSGFDLRCIAIRVRLFSEQFWQGDLYPRWLKDMYVGHGSPVFFYYPPLAYYAAALFAFLDPLNPFAYYSITASTLLSLLVLGAGCYGWLREELGDDKAALLGALLAVVAPVNLSNNFYYWLLFGAVWAYALAPWLFWAARRMALGHKAGAPCFALCLALLVLSNIPLTVIFGPCAVLYALWVRHRAGGGIGLRWLALAGAATLLGFALSAVFLGPALLYMDAAYISNHWDLPGTDYHRYFLLLGFRSLNQVIYTVVWLLLLSLTVMYSVAIRRTHPQLLFFSAICVACLLLMLPLSEFLWDNLPPLKLLQFPTRLLIVPSLCVAVLAAAAPRSMRAIGYGFLAVCMGAVFYTSQWEMVTSLDTLKEYDEVRLAAYQHNTEPYTQYLPSKIPVDHLMAYYYTLDGIKEASARPMVEVKQGEARIREGVWQPRLMSFYYEARGPVQLHLRQLNYRGFIAMLPGNTLLLPQTNPDDGRMVLNLPAGAGEVKVELAAEMPEAAGKMISLVSLAVLVIWLLLARRRGVSGKW